MKCPKCGAKFLPREYGNEYDKYECGSFPNCGKTLTQSKECRVTELEQKLDVYRKLYEHALRCVDDTFQDYIGHAAILPNFLKLGDDKFEGVKKLAKEYLTLQKENVRLQEEVNKFEKFRDIMKAAIDDGRKESGITDCEKSNSFICPTCRTEYLDGTTICNPCCVEEYKRLICS